MHNDILLPVFFIPQVTDAHHCEVGNSKHVQYTAVETGCLIPSFGGRTIDSRSAHGTLGLHGGCSRPEEHTSELQSLMRNSYSVFCLHKQNSAQPTPPNIHHLTPNK